MEFLLAFVLMTSDHGSADHGHHHAAEATAQSTVAADVRTVDPEARSALLRHEAMPELGMPSMVMEFGIADDVDMALFAPGAALMITAVMGDDGLTVIAAEPEAEE